MANGTEGSGPDASPTQGDGGTPNDPGAPDRRRLLVIVLGAAAAVIRDRDRRRAAGRW